MLKNIPEARQFIADRMSELRLSVFTRPPSDWPAFQQLLGRYMELNELHEQLAKPLIEDDKS